MTTKISSDNIQPATLAALSGGASTTVYETLSAIPLSGNDTGDRAFVRENNRLYVWNGVGWFNIALLNTSPVITEGVVPVYSLPIDGSPLVLTLIASDPEGIPITWSFQITGGTLGNTATISQNNNVFTITPSTNQNDAGSFQVTFTASDGVNIAVANTQLVLNFSAWNVNNLLWRGDSSVFSVTSQETLPNGIHFSPDGLNMYIVGQTGDDVNQYTLSTAWQVTSATFVRIFSVATQETGPSDVFFSPDGLRMYITGTASDSVHQYTLTTPWNISTATFTRTRSVVSEESAPQSIFFSPDGINMYVMGSSGDDVNQYTLSTAWDISTATYVRLFSVATQETAPTGLFFRSDGLKMYVMGTQGNDINEYNLSSAWNISTATFVEVRTVIDQYNETGAQGLFFRPDGAEAFVVGLDIDAVITYTLNTPWSVATMRTKLTKARYIGTEESTPRGLFFRSDGLKMYVIGSSGDDVNEYDLSTAWEVSTATFVRIFSVASQDTSPSGIFFRPDGLKMYVLGSTGVDVNEYNLSTPWNISTASFVINTSIVDPYSQYNEGSPEDLYIKPDGTEMYITGLDTDAIITYSLATPWSIAGMRRKLPDNYFPVAAQDGSVQQLFFRPDGLKMYVLGASNDSIYQYNLTTAWKISTASYEQQFSVILQEASPAGLFFSPDGLNMYVTGASGDDVNQYTLSTPWNISTAFFVRLFSVAAEEITPEGIFFTPDGTTMYITGSTGDDVNQYTLTTPWNISTASFVRLFSVAAQETIPVDIFFSPDGLNMYVIGTVGDDVNQYTLTTPWNISTASFVRLFSFSAVELTPAGLFFSPDGLNMYIIGEGSDGIYQYTLSTPWNISTAAPWNESFYSLATGVQETSPNGIDFKPDGTRVYVTGSAADRINEYHLSTPWDLGSATFVRATNTIPSILGSSRSPEGVKFSPSGDIMYVLDLSTDIIFQYDLGN